MFGALHLRLNRENSLFKFCVKIIYSLAMCAHAPTSPTYIRVNGIYIIAMQIACSFGWWLMAGAGLF
jgi:hypothetical protein